MTTSCPHGNQATSQIWDGTQTRSYCGLCGDAVDGLGSLKHKADRKGRRREAVAPPPPGDAPLGIHGSAGGFTKAPALSSLLTLSTCAGYEARLARLSDWTACPGDGHAQCGNCVHYAGRRS